MGTTAVSESLSSCPRMSPFVQFSLGLCALLGSVHGLVLLARVRWPHSRTLVDMHVRACSWWVLIAVLLPVLALGHSGALAACVAIQLAICMEIGHAVEARVAGEPLERIRRTRLLAFALATIACTGLAFLPQFERNPSLSGGVLVLWCVATVQLSDALQYVAGKLFGRVRLAPRVSPSKTVEGLVLGGLGAAVAACLLHGFTPFTAPQAFFVALGLVTTGVLGGLASSALKRRLGCKDWSRLLPGHGGVLDRVDSLVLSAPLCYLAAISLAGR